MWARREGEGQGDCSAGEGGSEGPRRRQRWLVKRRMRSQKRLFMQTPLRTHRRSLPLPPCTASKLCTAGSWAPAGTPPPSPPPSPRPWGRPRRRLRVYGGICGTWEWVMGARRAREVWRCVLLRRRALTAPARRSGVPTVVAAAAKEAPNSRRAASTAAKTAGCGRRRSGGRRQRRAGPATNIFLSLSWVQKRAREAHSRSNPCIHMQCITFQSKIKCP